MRTAVRTEFVVRPQRPATEVQAERTFTGVYSDGIARQYVGIARSRDVVLSAPRTLGNRSVQHIICPTSSGAEGGRVTQRESAPPTSVPNRTDYSRMTWQQLLPTARGTEAKGAKRTKFATVDNRKREAPALTYDDKHVAVDPAAGTSPPPGSADGQQEQELEAAITAAVDRVRDARGAIPAREVDRDPYSSKHAGNFYDPVVAGWQPQPDDGKKRDATAWNRERNQQKKADDPDGAAYQSWLKQAVPTGVDPGNDEDMKKWQIFNRLIPMEGRIGTITTFDKTLTVGVGFSSAGRQAETVIAKALDALPETKDVAFAAGLIAGEKGGMRVVDTDRKWVLEGPDAAAYVQTNQALLSLLVNLSQGTQTNTAGDAVSGDEQAEQRQAWLDAQWQTFLAHALHGIPADILAWPLESVALATHSIHGAPGIFSWSFWAAHPDTDLRAMISAIYDALTHVKSLTWLVPITGGENGTYKDAFKAAIAAKQSAAPVTAGDPAKI